MYICIYPSPSLFFPFFFVAILQDTLLTQATQEAEWLLRQEREQHSSTQAKCLSTQLKLEKAQEENQALQERLAVVSVEAEMYCSVAEDHVSRES